MPTLIRQVAASNDDAAKRYQTTEAYSPTLVAISVGAGDTPPGNFAFCGGMRFTNITIPNGANIVSAKITFKASENQAGDTVRSRLRGYAADDASGNLSTEAKWDAIFPGALTSAVTWDNIGNWIGGNLFDTPDIASVIDAITSRLGWVSGNALILFWDDHDERSDVAARRRFASYDSAAADAAILTVVYDLGGQVMHIRRR